MDKIWQANYLTQGNIERYRLIMRFFYKRDRQMKGDSYRPDVLKMMQASYSKSYSEFDVDQDLEVLVKWGNLQKQQEYLQVKSIAEYRNKNFRYQITSEGALIEEMVYQIEHDKHTTHGSLDKETFGKLLELLQQFIKLEGKDIQIWQDIKDNFLKLRTNTAAYIRYIVSSEVDSQMKTEKFLVYKDKFINYLRDFISQIQYLHPKFQQVVLDLNDVNKEWLINSLYKKELAIPNFTEVKRYSVEEKILGEFQAIQEWFVGSPSRVSEYDNLIEQTHQMIKKMTDLIYHFGQEAHYYQSRKKDYQHLAQWFSVADDLSEANKMYAGIFGLSHTRHYYVSEAADTASTKEDSWNVEPSKLFLSKRGRGAREQRRAKAVKIDSELQDKIKQEYEEELIKSTERINSYFINKIIDFSKVDMLDGQSRRLFIKWIIKANKQEINSSKAPNQFFSQVVKTEFGFPVTVTIDKEHTISIPCEDGILEMKQVIIERGEI